jgi:hypothetical protein
MPRWRTETSAVTGASVSYDDLVRMRGKTLAAALLLSALAAGGCSFSDGPQPRSTWTGGTAGELVAVAGEEHCDWESITILRLDQDREFVRDPEGVVGQEWLTTTYLRQTTLPADAKNTGYTHEQQALWLSADDSAAFVVEGATAERWPRTVRGWGCD